MQLLPKETTYDFIIGSDLVYTEAGAACLPLVIKAHCRADTRVLYAHTRGRFEHLDMEFFDQLRASGLHVEEVFEPGAPTPPPSPPPLTDIFRDQRIAIYQMRLAVDKAPRS
jgi:predicted nicotinamide N-methyase